MRVQKGYGYLFMRVKKGYYLKNTAIYLHEGPEGILIKDTAIYL